MKTSLEHKASNQFHSHHSLSRSRSNSNRISSNKKTKEPKKSTVWNKRFHSNQKTHYSKEKRLQAIKGEARTFNQTDHPLICYAYNTFIGVIRDRNEDKVAAKCYIPCPKSKNGDTWPTVHFFAIFDGHGGETCSSFLKSNFLGYLLNDSKFPEHPESALMNSFITAEVDFINKVKPFNIIDYYDRSGSCALVLLIIDKNCYCAGLGDSLGFYSSSMCSTVFQLNTEHKPNNPKELKRIEKAGGTVYKKSSTNSVQFPWRVLPGHLSVSRSIGDITSKIAELGGNPNVLIAIPEITTFEIDSTSDFILLGSDGIFDALSIQNIIEMVFLKGRDKQEEGSSLKLTKDLCNSIITESLAQGSTDNLSCIVITFEHLLTYFNEASPLPKAIECRLLKSIEISNDFKPLNGNLYSITPKKKSSVITGPEIRSLAKMTAYENYQNRFLSR